MEGPTETLARYIVDTKFSDFPDLVIKKAKRCVLDSIGCALGGHATELGHNVASLMRELGGRSDATIFGSGTRVMLPNAVLANTYMANILDYDDTRYAHPGCTIIPSALGAAEMTDASGSDVLTAVIVGYEVSIRVAAAMHYASPTRDSIRGPSHQTFGSVSSASKILLRGRDEVLDAIGIAGATAPVPSNTKTSGEENIPPTMKIGFYAYSMIGTLSALLARNGITGPHNILDGITGFWRMIGADKCDFGRMTRDLGREYEILNTAFKPYSCCRWFHSSIDALLDLVKEHGIEVNAIEEIDIRTVSTKSNVGYLSNPKPDNVVGAVFSLPYSAAVSLSGIKPGPDWLSNDTLNNDAILALAKKVRCVFEEKSESESDAHKWPSTVKVKTTDGTYSKHVQHPKGSPENIMSEQELDDKFVHLARFTLDEERTIEVRKLIGRLEQLGNISELTSLL